VDGAHNYTIDVSIHDDVCVYYNSVYEETVNASLEIFIDGVLVLDEELYQHDYSYDEDSYMDAWGYLIYEFLAIDTANITISGSLGY
jgi:hypothetical protein